MLMSMQRTVNRSFPARVYKRLPAVAALAGSNRFTEKGIEITEKQKKINKSEHTPRYKEYLDEQRQRSD